MIDCILLITAFIIGTLLGSFFTLAVYRIPLKKDITHERSFCPNCNHKLNFLDLIPILSYIFLKGKCRYCKQKIRPRYLILEILSGVTFLVFSLSVKLNIFEIDLMKIGYLIFGFMYISSLIIIAGIDKENKVITKSILIFGIVIEALYIIYLYCLKINIYRYIIYWVLMLVIIIIMKNKYLLQYLALFMYILVGSKEIIALASLMLALVISVIYAIIKKDNMKDNLKDVPIGCILSFTNIVFIIIGNFLLTNKLFL